MNQARNGTAGNAFLMRIANGILVPRAHRFLVTWSWFVKNLAAWLWEQECKNGGSGVALFTYHMRIKVTSAEVASPAHVIRPSL